MIPCKNCITFAICNAQITDNSPFEDVVYKLMPKCSLIKEYIESSIYKSLLESSLVLEVLKYFNH